MVADAEKLCRSLHGCQVVSESAPPELELFRLGKTVQLTYPVPYLPGKVYWWW